ncbi:uncharacterized protein A4U43_UnF7590 [Asparagus officinalis]|uniref:ELM2 domain-containing protein n=1 Tax=Asparagus officinalis TaxID=4686 RepID=A0A1R3L661_ASPOF|nr:AT-rich interactive domain-containing protein 1-like [Asparagus officinalis]ONK55103.1 uncharacterized protein A4U43_UnF7590 [Asparagus officinalis]
MTVAGDAGSPAASSCLGCAKAESKIRALLDYISNTFSKNPSSILGFEVPKSEAFDCSDLFHRWLQIFDKKNKSPVCPDLKKRIEALVFRLLMEEKERLGCRKRKFDEGLVEILRLVRGVAVNPGNGADGEWKDKILRARMATFLRAADVTNAKEVPYLKKQRSHKFLSAKNGGSDNCSALNRRKSPRTLLKLGNGELPRKRIPVGPTFQADVPDWRESANKKNISDERDDSKWLGTQIWPIEGENRQISEEMIGKGKEYSCDCTSRGSFGCIRFHVKTARLHLKSDLGPAFFGLGFSEIGEEEISKSWTQEEQMKFDELVRQNPTSEGKSFWEPALEYFTTKSRKDIVSYYFNVCLLRWMGIRTRSGAQIVDYSDDESFGWD